MVLSFGTFSLAGTELTGDVTMASVGGVDVSSGHVEIHALTLGSRTPSQEGRSVRAASKTAIDPVRLTKRTDQTTPLLYEGHARNTRLDGDIRIFDNHPETGETRHRFTVRLTQARIVSIETHVPDAFDTSAPARPPYDVVELMPHTIAYVDEVHSVEFEQTWSDGR